jgi:3-oxoacyl-[acyl-carrier-protein] synthase-3
VRAGNVSGNVLGDPLLKMDGQAVFKLAVSVLDKALAPRWKKRSDGCRHRLADSAPGQYPHHAKHGAQAQAVHGQGGGDRRSAWQHLGGLDSAGARSRRAQRTGQKGQTVLLEGVGGGFTWGAVLLKM